MHLQHQSIMMMIAASVIVFLQMIIAVNSGRPPAVTWIRRCCKEGEQLQVQDRLIVTQNAILEEKHCIPSNDSLWVPKIRFPLQRRFHEPFGTAPAFIKFKENSPPLDICRDPKYVVGNDSILLIRNGSLFVAERDVFIQKDFFCVDKDSAIYCLAKDEEDTVEINRAESLVTNESNWIRKLTTIRKCCSPSAAYNSNRTECITLDRHDPLNNLSVFDQRNLKQTKLDLLFGFPTKCENRKFLIVGQFEAGMFDEEKNVLRLDNGLGKELTETEFCLEHTLTEEGNREYSSSVKIFGCDEHFPGPVILPDQNKINDDVRFKLFGIGLLISVVFLTATLIVSFLVPSNHHVLHWRCQIYYVVCLLAGDLLLAITQLSHDLISGPFCTVTASLMHFCFLAAFFWLNCMSFNIWWTFRDFRPTSLEKRQEICRLRLYELYAWGFPLIFACIALILDNLPESANSDNFLRPRFGERACWFYGDLEILTYFYGPIGILLIINVLLFISTTRQLTCGLWKRDDVKSTTEKSALGRVCMKLVIVMGVTWIADVISWAVGGPHYLWYVTDFINAIQGVFIFIVVGCQPQIWAAVKRIWNSKTERNINNTTNGPQHSSSSHGLPSMGDTITNNTFTNTTTMNHSNNNNHNNSGAQNKIPLETVC